MMSAPTPIDLRSPRAWVSLAILVAAYFLFDPLEALVHQPVAHAQNLHMIVDGAMALAPYTVLMVVRIMILGVCVILQTPVRGFPLVGANIARNTLLGIGIGLIVMVAAISAIWLSGNARVAPSSQSIHLMAFHGTGWFLADFLGATGEELFGRVAVLLVAERFVGWRGAIVVSGLMFSVLHLGNPGASWIWILRLFLQGMLLAYAVYKTGSVWWSVGYHTGWNWASAPLFGAAGSGYLDQGHLFDFTPTGPTLITGGTVGPEGSIFAFVAVLCALALFVAFTRDRTEA
ncbi:CPBP family intramembrane metalloprotease [Sphingomonas koreensis]|nr:CPBP family intramembrane metalloprotease [Sphingomonas koreensis]